MDKRNEILASNLINYSCRLKPGEKVLIEARGYEATELVNLLVKEAYKAGAYPFVSMECPETKRALLMGLKEEQVKLMAELDGAKMAAMDAYIGIGAEENSAETSDVPQDNMKLYAREYSKKVHSEIRLTKKWVVLRYPTPSMAQAAGKSNESFKEFYYNVCNLDYSKMNRAMDSLKALMEKTDKVQIKGPGTDLTFSIKGMPTVKCAGECNIPDGEIFTAPVKNSVNGCLSYNTPSRYQGFTYENIKFIFEEGKIVKAAANNTDRVNEILDADEGARFIGEFAIGVNPYIDTPMTDTLFDEKIKGSFHFTPGNAYDDADNTNRSSIHWDLVCIQTPEYGGGEIYFDGVLIRKDGRFVLPELECLNPENLI